HRGAAGRPAGLRGERAGGRRPARPQGAAARSRPAPAGAAMTEFEDLPEPVGRQQRRRLRIDIAVGALVLLLVVLVFRATTQHHGKPAAAIVSSTPAAPIGGFGTPPDSGSGLLAGMATAGLATSLPTDPDDDPTICPPS